MVMISFLEVFFLCCCCSELYSCCRALAFKALINRVQTHHYLTGNKKYINTRENLLSASLVLANQKHNCMYKCLIDGTKEGMIVICLYKNAVGTSEAGVKRHRTWTGTWAGILFHLALLYGLEPDTYNCN